MRTRIDARRIRNPLDDRPPGAREIERPHDAGQRPSDDPIMNGTPAQPLRIERRRSERDVDVRQHP